MSHPTIKDEDLGRLPLSEAKSELLGEITRTPAESLPSDRRPRWVPVAASVAAVALLLAVPVWKLSGGRSGALDEPPAGAPTAGPTYPPTPASSSVPATPPPSDAPEPTGAATGPLVVLTDPPMPSLVPASDAPSVAGGTYVALNAGWGVEYVTQSYGTREMTYRLGNARFEVTQYPADQYQGYYDDRTEISRPTAVTVLGRRATMWAYEDTDHTAIRVPEHGTFAEIRGSGMDQRAYRDLLDQLVLTDAEGLASTLPGDAVTPFDRAKVIRTLLQGVSVPPGFTADDVQLEGFNDSYQSAVGVAGAAACAWLAEWKADDPATHDAVLSALQGSTSWPLLRRIADQGGFSDEVWSAAAKLRAGRPVADIRSGICG